VGDVVLTTVGAVVGGAPSSALISLDGHESVRAGHAPDRRPGAAEALTAYGIDLVDVRLAS